MGLFGHQSWFAADDDDDDNDSAAQAPASEANNVRPVEMINFFAAERERMPARLPSPDNHGAGSEMFTANMAALQAELRRLKEDNQRLRSMINEMYALQQHGGRSCSPSSSSASPTPPPDAHDVSRPPHHDLRRPPNNDVPESSNAAAMRGRGEVGPVDDGGLPKRRKEKGVVVDEASDGREESSEDDDQHCTRNSNKKLKLSPPPPEKDEMAAAKRKHRVIVRIRTETGDINGTVKIDGCLWRKYGQKNPIASPKTPRCYYRCSMTAENCPVRKHLQKCADDESIVNVTYEGAHNHPLPREAIPMASATDSALKMVMSGSMPNGEALMDTSVLAATMPPCTRAPRTATVSISSPFPTALLDLSKSPDPDRFQEQPLAVQFPAAFLDGAAPGGPSRVIHMSAEMLNAAFAHFRTGGGGGGSGDGAAH